MFWKADVGAGPDDSAVGRTDRPPPGSLHSRQCPDRPGRARPSGTSVVVRVTALTAEEPETSTRRVSEAVTGVGNGDAETLEVADGVGLDSLAPPGAVLSVAVPLPPSPIGRVGVVQGSLLRSPVGQR